MGWITQMIKYLFAFCLISNIAFASDRIYIDETEIDQIEDCFHIHTGGNIWIQTETVHRDATGLYTLEQNLIKRAQSSEYERKWKCPYCNMYWPVGKPCQNSDCPSRYR